MPLDWIRTLGRGVHGRRLNWRCRCRGRCRFRRSDRYFKRVGRQLNLLLLLRWRRSLEQRCKSASSGSRLSWFGLRGRTLEQGRQPGRFCRRRLLLLRLEHGALQLSLLLLLLSSAREWQRRRCRVRGGVRARVTVAVVCCAFALANVRTWRRRHSCSVQRRVLVPAFVLHDCSKLSLQSANEHCESLTQQT